MKITFSPLKLPTSGILALGVGADKKLSEHGAAVDKSLKSLIKRTLTSSRFAGKSGQFTLIHTPLGSAFEAVALVGLGVAKELNVPAIRKAGATLARGLDSAGIKAAAVAVELPRGTKLSAADASAEMAYGALLKSYRFDKYHTQLKEEQKAALAKLTFLSDDSRKASANFTTLSAIAEGVTLTRDLVSEPANIIHPESLAARCKELTKLGVKVELLNEAAMEVLGMGALLGVGQGSSKESHLVVMQWKGNPKSKDVPLAVVGKGVTFDTGGISIKPAGGMEDMKWDMGGAGVTIGLMHTLATRKAKVNVVGVVGLVENMPSGDAQRPGDVVTTMSGQTVEVINTDAEGRLVLADALWYTQDRFKPKHMVNLATLTGAIIVALGKSRAGLFSNNDKLAKMLHDAGESEGERLWRFPVGEEYAAHISSDIADMKNVGRTGQAGSISAAEFLSRYVNKTPWAHLDIAGVAWAYEEQDLCRKGASGFGVRLLNHMIAENFEG